MPIRVYQSTDVGAPVLAGTADSLRALLSACLVSGYGALTGAGWTQEYAGAGRAAFRAGSAPRHYLQVFDAGESSQSTREARLRAFETMTAVDVGASAFPTVSQQANGLVVRKSTSLDTAARPWLMVADAGRFHLFINPGDWSSRFTGFFFGSLISYKTGGDDYATGIWGRDGEGNAENVDHYSNLCSNVTATLGGHFIARAYTGLGSGAVIGKISDYATANQANMGGDGTAPVYPNGPDGGLYVDRVRVTQGGFVRGHVPGLWCPLHQRPLSHGDVVSGTSGQLAGRTLLAISLANNALALLETANGLNNTWD